MLRVNIATVTVYIIVASPLLAQEEEALQNTDVDTIVVEGTRKSADYVEGESSVAGFSIVPIKEVPQSVQILTRDLIDDTGALSVGELMQNVPGSSNSLARTTPFGTASLQVRGQPVLIYRDGLRDIDFSDIDQSALNNVERIDVIKGPAGLVYGTGGPGGVINVVTKRPLETFHASGSVTLGDYDTKIVAGDVSVPLGSGFGFRATGEIERSDSFIDFSEVQRDNFSGVFAYDDGGRLTASLVYEDFSNQDDQAMTRVGLPVSGTIINTDVIEIDRETYLGEPAFDFTNSFGNMLSGYTDFQLTEKIKISAAARRATVYFDQAEVRTLGALDLDIFTVPRSRARSLELEEEQVNARVLVNALFDTASLAHDLSVGYEHFDFDLFVDNRSVANGQVPSINVVDPDYLETPLVTGVPFVFTETSRSDEYFLQDVIRYRDTTVTAAVRQVSTDFEDNFGLDESLDVTVYQLGATHDLSETLSVFAGYNTGFNANSGIASTQSRNGERFDPEDYRQYEAGIKISGLQGITATLSAFDLVREGILVADPQDADFLVQVGEEQSRGLEADIVWSPNRSWAVTGGYLYLDTEITEDTDPARQGNERPGAPAHRANIFASYTFFEGPLANVRLSAGASYTGETFASLENALKQPAYTTLDLGASYTLGALRLDAFLSNALDETYFIARNEFTVNPGTPRFFRVRATYDF